MAISNTEPRSGARHVDVVGRVETRGIDYIPEHERHSSPRELAWAMIGGQCALGGMVAGSLPIAFGLGWWAAVSAVTVGLVIGTLAFVPMALIGPRTGTNGTVSSGAFFGVRGRLLGTGLVMLDCVLFYAVLTWTAGQAAIGGMNRFFGTPTGNVELSIAMGVVFLAVTAVAILGHATLVASLRFVMWTSGVVAILAVITLVPHFQAVQGGDYLLGSFWTTWALTTSLAIALPVTWAPFINDYGRYVASDASRRAVGGWAGLGLFVGCWLALVIAAFVTTTFTGTESSFVYGFIDAVPIWLVAPLVLALGLAANVVASAMSVYCAGLDLHGVLWRATRAQVTVVLSLLGLATAYAAFVATDAERSVQASFSLLLVTIAPWMVVNVIGHVRSGGRYAVLDLHAFMWPGTHGRYWFWHGLDPRALAAWVAGVGVGLMFTNTSFFTGPLVDNVETIDLSFISAATVTAALYLTLLHAYPERNDARTEQLANAAERGFDPDGHGQPAQIKRHTI